VRLNDLALGCIALLLGLGVLFEASRFPEMAGMDYGPDFFPKLIGAAFVLVGVGLIVQSVRAGSAGGSAPLVAFDQWWADRASVIRAITVVVAVPAYALLVARLGFILTVGVIALVLLVVMRARWWQTVAIVILLPLLLHQGFAGLLRVPLPRGVIERWLF